MTLTVRLDRTLETALERHCAATGTSKSHVVQESLAAYLLAAEPAMVLNTAHGETPISDNFRAFADAGLVGGVALTPTRLDAGSDTVKDAGSASADKAAVRARVAARSRTRPSGT